MKQCSAKWASEAVTDWKALISCFKGRVDADNRAALLAEQEAAKRKIEEDKQAAEQRRIDETRRAEERKLAEEEAKRQAEIRHIEQQKRDEERKIAAEKLDAEVVEIERLQECVEPSERSVEMIRDNFEIELFDARSARFHSTCEYNREHSSSNPVICGLINSKNAMGAYVGYKPFYASVNSSASKAIISDKRDDLLSKMNLEFHCFYCSSVPRSMQGCEAAVARGKYDPMSEALQRRSKRKE